MTENPLLTPWTTPFGLPPFAAIDAAHFPPAFEAAMAAHRAEVAEIGANPTAPSFANTIEALEGAGRLLSRIGAIALDPGLFRRVSALHEARESLDLALDQRRLLERLYLRLTRAGAGLDAKARARLSEISTRLATLHTSFGQNVLADENEWRMALIEADLDGLPDFARQAAREAAAAARLDGYVFTLSRSSAEPFLTFSARRDLREKLWRGFAARGALTEGRENAPLVREILMLRRERAQLLGEADFASFRLRDTMAGSPDAAEGLLRACWEPAKRRIAIEKAELEEFARAAGHNGPIEPWDWRYWAERARQAKHNFDGAALKPHFELEAMLRAIFDTARRLFGLVFQERADIPRYHADVRGFEALDEAGNHVGLLLLDNYARPGKRSGAWMSSFRVADGLGGRTAPIIINNNNLARATPTLLSLDEARTLFHEFGLPSQIMEHWLSLPETLQTHARHHETGAALDEALLGRVLAARNDGQGFAMVEYLSCALIDLALHRHEAPEDLSLEEFETDFLAEIGMPEGMALRHRPIHFGHLFSGDGYAAGYYFYLWAEVLDADGFEAFEEAGDPFHPDLAARLKSIFEAGDTADPMALYTGFRGRPPQVDALLRKRGLVGA
ncbi:MAG: M3 family metallopeptidase [Acetobacteraceae bacterium]|nr:M3 family metallopeptidase [Acetobacteraceae bacterium]